MNPSIKNIWGSIRYPKKYGPKIIGGEVKEVKEVKLCHNCGHLQETVCQMNKQVMRPNDHCSRWSE